MNESISRIKHFLDQLRSLFFRRPLFQRSDYKNVWNSVSKSEDNAKFAVAGYTDENQYTEAASSTKSMLIELLGISQSDTVLEIGAGVGRVGAAIAPMCKEWIGCDVSENMITHMKKRLSHLSNVKFLTLSGYDLSGVPSNYADVIYSTVVFMHLDEWERFRYIKDSFRVLKPGGRLLVDNVDLTSDKGWEFFLDHVAIPPANRPPQISKTSTPEEIFEYFKRSLYIDIDQHRVDLWIITIGKKPEE
jgi:ubiquinone/menaquinone biosynthesis C-methylase UbiE